MSSYFPQHIHKMFLVLKYMALHLRLLKFLPCVMKCSSLTPSMSSLTNPNACRQIQTEAASLNLTDSGTIPKGLGDVRQAPKLPVNNHSKSPWSPSILRAPGTARQLVRADGGRVSLLHKRKLRFRDLVTGPNSGGRRQRQILRSAVHSCKHPTGNYPLSSLSVLVMEVREDLSMKFIYFTNYPRFSIVVVKTEI